MHHYNKVYMPRLQRNVTHVAFDSFEYSTTNIFATMFISLLVFIQKQNGKEELLSAA
jgi:hypothetical protein